LWHEPLYVNLDRRCSPNVDNSPSVFPPTRRKGELGAAQASRDKAEDAHGRAREELQAHRQQIAALQGQLAEQAAAHAARQEETAQEVAALRADKEALAASLAKKTKAADAAERKVTGLQQTAESLRTHNAGLETQAGQLKAELADMLEEQMERELDIFANTSAGAEFQRTGSIVSNTGKHLKRKASPESANKNAATADVSDKSSRIRGNDAVTKPKPEESPVAAKAKQTSPARVECEVDAQLDETSLAGEGTEEGAEESPPSVLPQDSRRVSRAGGRGRSKENEPKYGLCCRFCNPVILVLLPAMLVQQIAMSIRARTHNAPLTICLTSSLQGGRRDQRQAEAHSQSQGDEENTGQGTLAALSCAPPQLPGSG